MKERGGTHRIGRCPCPLAADAQLRTARSSPMRAQGGRPAASETVAAAESRESQQPSVGVPATGLDPNRFCGSPTAMEVTGNAGNGARSLYWREVVQGMNRAGANPNGGVIVWIIPRSSFG
jgi:hypothetical protein